MTARTLISKLLLSLLILSGVFSDSAFAVVHGSVCRVVFSEEFESAPKSEIRFLTTEDVIELYQSRVKTPENLGGWLRSRELLESAVASPEATFGGVFLHEDIFAMAATYAYHISENQPFIDGNKRIGLTAALVFLEMNGHPLNHFNEVLFQAMKSISVKKMSKTELANLLRSMAVAKAS